jgi:ATP-dependent Lhr-like helicase
VVVAVWARALPGVSSDRFGQLLRNLAAHDLIVQDHDGTIVIGLSGERLVNHYEFYAAFTSPEEYRLVADGQTLGTLPIVMPLVPGQYMIFAGRRWRIVDVDDRRKVAELVSAPGGRAPPFYGGSGALVHDRVRREMRSLLASDRIPRYLDATARGLLLDARAAYRELGLDRRTIVEHSGTTVLFHWAGDRVANTLMLAFIRAGLEVTVDGMVLSIVDASPTAVRAALEEIAGDTGLQAFELAAAARNKEREKHHRYLDQELLTLDYAASELDLDGARGCVEELVSSS